MNWTKYVITAGQLREWLEDVPDDTPVILVKDAEGNGYSPLASVDTDEGTVYEPESTWAGEVYTKSNLDEGGYYPLDAVRVVELGPVN